MSNCSMAINSFPLKKLLAFQVLISVPSQPSEKVLSVKMINFTMVFYQTNLNSSCLLTNAAIQLFLNH